MASKKVFDSQDFGALMMVLQAKKKVEMTVVTGSMIPLIQIGEKITVEPFEGEAKKFDIVVFHHKNILVCHYVWHVNRLTMGSPLTYSTRGLANAHEDIVPCTSDKVLGKVTSHRLKFGHKLKTYFQRTGYWSSEKLGRLW